MIILLGVAAYYGLGEQLQGRFGKVSPTMNVNTPVKESVYKKIVPNQRPEAGTIDGDMDEYRPPGSGSDSRQGSNYEGSLDYTLDDAI